MFLAHEMMWTGSRRTPQASSGGDCDYQCGSFTELRNLELDYLHRVEGTRNLSVFYIVKFVSQSAKAGHTEDFPDASQYTPAKDLTYRWMKSTWLGKHIDVNRRIECPVHNTRLMAIYAGHLVCRWQTPRLSHRSGWVHFYDSKENVASIFRVTELDLGDSWLQQPAGSTVLRNVDRNLLSCTV